MKERYKGYIEGCEFFGATYKDEWIVTSTRDEEKNINQLKRFFKNDGPTALIATSHYVSQQILKVAKKIR